MKDLPRRILVPTDFSDTADRALLVARQLATALAAEIHVVHVRILLEDPHLVEEHQLELERLLTRGDQKTREVLSHHVSSETSVVVHPHLVRGLSASESIVEAAGDLGCDLIVIGTHGRRGIKHLLLGSVTEAVVRSSSIPVLTVRGDAVLSGEPAARILVPHDFSEHSLPAVQLAAHWARHVGAHVTLLHVVEPVVYPEFYAVDLMPDDMLHRVVERSREALQKVAQEELEGIPNSVEVVTGRATEAITEFAQPARYDLIVMPTRGLSALEHLILGSVAEAVLRRSRIPVLTIRAHRD
ncbi:MAG: universal stress protein [Acidobacteria bacterium]|jgi:nucleotide-binding universal stress UspA family protein|nr:universal stress protein [Acidobacteriota bacterium]